MEKQILKDKDKKALNLFKLSTNQKLKQKQNRVIEMSKLFLENVISESNDENKLDISIAVIIASVIEYLLKNKKKYKADKLSIAINTFESLFGSLNDLEKKTITKNINQVVELKLIQKISNFDLCKGSLSFFLKNILF